MRHGRKNRTKKFDGYKRHMITCPNQVSLPFREGGKVQFPSATCLSCPKRKKCTTSKKGRSITIHPDEKFIAELRERQLNPTGRAKLRERVAVEHSLSHIGRWQGDKARYIGTRKIVIKNNTRGRGRSSLPPPFSQTKPFSL